MHTPAYAAPTAYAAFKKRELAQLSCSGAGEPASEQGNDCRSWRSRRRQ
jgi:hypothetical protein